jgi:hypothetical protein
MSSLTDVVSTFKNLVTVVSALNVRRQTSITVTVPTLVVASTGTLLGYSVTVAGTTAGTINNTTMTTATAAGNVLVAVPNSVGATQLNIAFSQGLVVVPGTGQSVNVTYSLG